MALRSVTSGSPDGGVAAATLAGAGLGLPRSAMARGGDVATVACLDAATGAEANGRTVAGFWSAMAVRSMLAGPAKGSAADSGAGAEAGAGAAAATAASVGDALASTLRLCLEASISPGETTLRD